MALTMQRYLTIAGMDNTCPASLQASGRGTGKVCGHSGTTTPQKKFGGTSVQNHYKDYPAR